MPDGRAAGRLESNGGPVRLACLELDVDLSVFVAETILDR
jgi:hypothetical protein